MKKHLLLNKVVSKLSNQFHFDFLNGNVLTVSLDADDIAFAHLIVDEDQYPGIILSLAIDFPEAYIASDLTLSLMHICPIALGEVFYLSRGGNMFWSEDAHSQCDIENNSDLLTTLTPITDSVH